jgi:broad specificity phosphatase PhoE
MLDFNPNYYQQDALREAGLRRLEHLARQARHDPNDQGVWSSPFQRRLVAVAVALVTVLGVVALI